MSRPRLLLLLLLAAAAAVRVIFFLQIRSTDLVQVPLLDSQTYHDWAVRLASGDWGRGESYWMAPLYPHLLAAVYALFGVGSQVIIGLQLALTVLNIWLVHRLARRLADETTALLAAALYAFYAAPVFYAGLLMLATVATTLFLLVALQLRRAHAVPTTGRWFTLGLGIGLAGLARGNMLVMLAAAPLLLWWMRHSTDAAPPGIGRPRAGRLVVALLAGGLLVLLPVTIRNLVMADDFVILTSNGGLNLLIGQRAGHQGLFGPAVDELQAVSDASLELTLEAEQGRDLKGSEVSRLLVGRAWREFRDNLGSMPRHYLLKIYRFWNGYEVPQLASFDHWRGEFGALRILPVPYVLLAAAGLLGLAVASPRQRPVLAILIGAYFLSLLPFFPTSRYRQPLAPVLAVSAAIFLTALWRGRGTMASDRRRLWILALVLLMAGLWPRWGALPERETERQVLLNNAMRAAGRGDLHAVLAAGRRAEEVAPGLADTPFRLAMALGELGAHEDALAALELAATRAPRSRLVPYLEGRHLEALDRQLDALAAYGRAAALDTTWARPYLRSGLVLRRLGRLDRAIAALEKARRRQPGSRRVLLDLAALYGERGRLDESCALLEQLTAAFPRDVASWYNLALSRWRAGQDEQARAALARAELIHEMSDDQHRRLENLRRILDGTGAASP